MNRREAENYRHLMNTLEGLGFTPGESQGLIRIEKTLHRWCERECGDDHGCIERDEETGKALYRSAYTGKAWPIADREKGALKRLKVIMATHPGLSFYYQTDPRGCALYILRPGDVPEGSTPDSCYTRGIAICY